MGVPEFVANAMAFLGMLAARLKGGEAKVTPEMLARITGNRLFDISKAERELGFSPAVNYERGAREIVDEYLQKGRQNPY